MKKKVLSLILAVLIAVAAIPFSACAAGADTTENFCKIKKVSTLVYFQFFDDVELSAEYYADPEKDAELVWALDGNSKFVDGGLKETTTGSTATVKFLGNTTVKLQLISSDGEVLAEDELYVEDGKTKGVDSFFANIFISVYFVIFFILNMVVEAFKIFF